ncbi:MAG: lasso RiPP family leader peptide-containing protein [Acidobacteriaceae bacterium]
MNPIKNESLSQARMARKTYEKPKLTTFGSVAKLTRTGGSEHLTDATMSTRKRPG